MRRSNPMKPGAALAAGLLLAACGPRELETDTETLQRLATASQAYAGAGTTELVSDTEAMELAGALYSAYCAECHGDDARGDRGVPDLTAGRFTYGTDAAAVRTTIALGRRSTMPAMGRELGEVELGQVVAYVEALGSEAALDDYERRGAALYAQHCTQCHGPEGRGVSELGAPSLVDDHWQHGGSMMSIRLAITRGIESQCPAHEGDLTAAEIDLLTAFVLGPVAGLVARAD